MLHVLSLGLLLLAIGLWLKWRSSKFSVFKDLGIPGPPPSIFFGNLLEMYKKGPVNSQTEWIQKYGGLLGYYYGSWPVLLVSDLDLMKQVLIKDFNKFSDRPSNLLAFEGESPDDPSSHHMINLKGKRWKEVRAMLTPSFTSGKLKQMLPLMNDCGSIMMSKLESASKNGTEDVEMVTLYEGLTMDTIGRSAFGIDASVQSNPNHPLLSFMRLLLDTNFQSLPTIFLLSFREFFFLLSWIRSLAYFVMAKGKNPIQEIFRLCQDVVKSRKGNPTSRRMDLLQTIIDAHSSGENISEESLVASSDEQIEGEKVVNGNVNTPIQKNLKHLSDDEVTANAYVFFIAGFETTSTTLAFLTHHLVNNPDVQERVRDEIYDVSGKDGPVSYDHLGKLYYTERVIMESLRMHPPIYNFENRVNTSEVHLGKWKIPAGMTMQIPVWSLHHDPENFEDPQTFNPDRFLPENRSKNHNIVWQPFGAGPRNCIGMRFALMEIKVTLIKMLRKYRLEPSKMTELGELKLKTNTIVIHPANGIHLKAVPL